MAITPQQTRSDPFTVIGYEARTTGAASADDIPALWARIGADHGLDRIPGHRTDDVYAVYTHLEHAGRSRDGWFSVVIGRAVDPATAVPPDMTLVAVPASDRLEFAVPDGDPARVMEAWQAAWDHDDAHKTFLAEYERYGADGSAVVSLGVR